ncbi:type II secretion system inner membrane protein GspF [Hyphococcus sp.]|uniref:type II secretion system inner membrane protein GspF n=1 Tax=Hyphococcus sp. TaxID=2038636 RepID=UPI0020867D1D|nr:MAG: type II secretion system protein GspF [Marinicaulis sp.]
MPAFEYEALDFGGRARKGVLSADSQRQARQELRRMNLTPLKLSAPRSEQRSSLTGSKTPRVQSGQLVMVTRQLAALIGAGVPLEEALNAVSVQLDSGPARTRLIGVRERVMEGWRFADALAEDEKSFPPLYRAVIAAGEASGDLSGVLNRLAEMLEKNRAIRNKAIASLIYPAALMVIAGGVVTALMVFVVPKIIEQFNSFNAQLPLLTKFVVGLSNWLVSYGLLSLLAIAIASAAFWYGMKRPAFKLVVDRFILRIPVIGRLSRSIDGARFARTLATLFSGGAPLLDSLVGAQRTVSNSHIRERLNKTVSMVGEGASLAASLKRADALPPMLVHMVAAGERSGALSQLLDKAAIQLEEEFDTASTVALRLLEPTIIVAMGGAVLVIVLSIMLPILRINTLAAG